MRLFDLDLPLPWLLALRYLKSTRRDAYASFLSAVAAGSIALGVAALVLVLALLSGFQRTLKDEVLSRTPQLVVELPPAALGNGALGNGALGNGALGNGALGKAEPGAVDAEALRDRLAAVPGVVEARVTVEGRGWAVVGGNVQPVRLVGYDGSPPATFPGARPLDDRAPDDRAPGGRAPEGGGDPAAGDPGGAPEGLYLSGALAARWGLAPGDRVALVSPRPTLTPFGPQPRLRSLPLTGVFDGSFTEEQQRAALPRPVAESLVGRDARRLELTAANLDRAPALMPRITAALGDDCPGCRVASWQELNRPLLFALRLEKALTFVAVALVVVVASLALVADLALIIASKRREIGMLGAMGAEESALRRAFLLLGGLLATAGVLLGGTVGVVAAWLLDRYQVVSVPGQVYFVDHVPFLVRPADVAAVVAFTFALALAASLYAARRATTQRPVEAIAR